MKNRFHDSRYQILKDAQEIQNDKIQNTETETYTPQWLKILRFMMAGNTITVKTAAELFDCYCLHKRIFDIYRYSGVACDSKMIKTKRSYYAEHYIEDPEKWIPELNKRKIYLRQTISLKPSLQS